jgi:spoIIIJ-associated protein
VLCNNVHCHLAKVKVCAKDTAEELTLNFLNTLIRNMGIDAEAKIVDVSESIPEGKTLVEKNISVEISAGADADGRGLGIIIGHHGEVLDSIQYLASLAANKRVDGKKEDYVRITVDVEGYRAKREETLRALARRMAAKVQKYKKSVMLEPMNPYERRIIHSEVQKIAGVSTNSIGSENNRKVVIFLEDK